MNDQKLRAILRSQKKSEFEFPGPQDRVVVVGSTGSGKSTFALYLFAESADFDKKPWILVDYKGERIIDALLREKDAELIKIDKDPPKVPGIYVLKPDPESQHAMADFLWKVYRRGKTGMFFDELSMIPEFKGVASSGGPLKAILTQGRAKNIPVYGLVQRPVEVNLHTFSEAQFISEFYLKKRADRDRVREYLPDDEPIFEDESLLPKHYSRWWDDHRRVALILKPGPDAPAILDIIAARVHRMRKNQAI
jgi:hypothetical protein